MRGMSEAELSHLGVGADEELVYRSALRSPGLGTEALALAAGMGVHELRAVLERLTASGMVTVAEDEGIMATDPFVVTERLVESRLTELQAEIQRVIAARHVVSVLLDDQRDGRRRSGPDGVERVEGADRVRARIDELAFFARHELLSVQPNGPLSAAAIEGAEEADTRALRRGLVMRTIMRSDALQDRRTADYLTGLSARGARIRTMDGPLERMLIFDRRTALVPIDPKETGRGALVVHQPGMISSLIALFERFWSAGEDLGQEHLTEIERRVLKTMVRVEKDEAGARELGISIRTYRGHVANLLRRLKATHRTQGVLAARDRGWL
ncbi:LuxR C-terminal-related transcriptional regulator [Kitasatospora cathayae]|uniref:LuxR C-terminal-related transcriptional regulator n=1 Tax=Kitasatospora cathayae TaxID=3004092 RepID=A0ABY7PXF8_9ACTN|nr:LuxR C-terminal-related transcriptional regulator [Kitasatospora sp. HUAS 3-15]WBP85127.1 LuxR C-terminal-related transcriptional regulator [Kitasatospora sp. HUAS 3-15]